jgi:hypothetical protein
MCFTQAPSQVNVNSNLCSEMDIVLWSGSGESEIEWSESLVSQEKGINIWGHMWTYVQGVFIFDRVWVNRPQLLEVQL